jgi:hypothetical protein
MTDDDMRMAAQIDVRYFGAYYKKCPTCGIQFSDLRPESNMMPHFYGDCKKSTASPTSND